MPSRYLEWGKSWSFLAGEESSQTQYSAQDDDGVQVFNHPIDAHFAAASMQGWPRIIMQVWELDEYGRSILSGYGFAHLPTNPGHHELEVRCWRPSGSMREELESFFLGTSSCVVDENVIFGKAWEKRSQLVTVSSGVVSLSNSSVDVIRFAALINAPSHFLLRLGEDERERHSSLLQRAKGCLGCMPYLDVGSSVCRIGRAHDGPPANNSIQCKGLLYTSLHLQT